MSNDSNPLIIVRFSQKSGAGEKALDLSSFVIGRDVASDVPIQELTVSRQHLRVFFDGQTVEIEDLGSINGTTYMGQKMVRGKRVRYQVGEKIKLGLAETFVWFEPQIKKDVTAIVENPMDVTDLTEAVDINELSKLDAMPLESVAQPILQPIEPAEPPPAPATKSEILTLKQREESAVVSEKRRTLRSVEAELSAAREEEDRQRKKERDEREARNLREVEEKIDQSIRHRDEILTQATIEAETVLAKATQESHKLLERTRQTADMIRKTAEQESIIFRQKKEKDLHGLLKAAEERAAKIIEAAEGRKNEILSSADVILQEATRDAEERLEQAKTLFSKVESEADAEKKILVDKFKAEMAEKFEEKKKIEKLISELNAETDAAKEQNAALKAEAERERFEIQRLQGEHAQKMNALGEFEDNVKKLKTEILSLESQHSNWLRTISDLQRKNEIEIKKTKEQGEEMLAGYEKALNAKLEKENQVIEEKRLELSKILKQQEDQMQKAFAERSSLIAKNLVKFLQIYHLENKEFDFKKLSDSQIREFSNIFHNNILVETKVVANPRTEVVAGKLKFSKEAKQRALAAFMVLAMILGVPQFLPQKYRTQFSLLDRINPSMGADRYIASLKNDRNRRYAPEKVDFVFDSFAQNAIYSKDFMEKWLSDSFQRKWSRRLQVFFYKKYRIPEEVMIQVASKEAALIENYKKASTEIHPDFFKVQFGKMQKDEAILNDEVKRLMSKDDAFRDYRQMVFQFYGENKDN